MVSFPIRKRKKLHTDMSLFTQKTSTSHLRMERSSRVNHGSLAPQTSPATSARVCSSAPSSHVLIRAPPRRHFGILRDHWRRAASSSSCHSSIPRERRCSGTRAHISSARHQSVDSAVTFALALQLRMDSTMRLVIFLWSRDMANCA